MPSACRLSLEEQASIRALKIAGHSNIQIAKQLGRNKSCIGRFLSNPNYGNKPVPGRHKKMGDRAHRQIGRLASNSSISCNQIKADLRLDVHRTTVLRAVHSVPYIDRELKVLTPNRKAQHKMNRVAFARNNMATQWHKVVFSDEKRWTLNGPDGDLGYWRDSRKPAVQLPKRSFGGGGVMIWAAFHSGGVLDLHFVTGRLNGPDYQQILA